MPTQQVLTPLQILEARLDEYHRWFLALEGKGDARAEGAER